MQSSLRDSLKKVKVSLGPPYSYKFKKYSSIISLSGIAVLLFGLLAGVKLVQVQQDLKSRAKVPPPPIQIERTNLILYFTLNTQADGKQVVKLERVEANNGYPPSGFESPYFAARGYSHQLEVLPTSPIERIKIIKFAFVDELEGEIFSSPESKQPSTRRVTIPLEKPEVYIVTSYKTGQTLIVRDLRTNEITPIPKDLIDAAISNKKLVDPNPRVQRIFPSVAPESSF